MEACRFRRGFTRPLLRKPRKDTEPLVVDPLDDTAARKIQELWKVVLETGKEEEKGDSKRRESGKKDWGNTEREVTEQLQEDQIQTRKEDLTTEEVKKLELEEFARMMNSFDARKSGKDSRHYGYFGMENEAAEHFQREMTVTAFEIPERKWPDDALVGKREHWMSEA